MDMFEGATLPKNGVPECVRLYLECQRSKDYSTAKDAIFTEDAIFDGLVVTMKGQEEIIEGFKAFTATMLSSIRVEAIAEAGSPETLLLLLWVRFAGQTEDQPFADLIQISGAKIARVNNCFDVTKVPSPDASYNTA